MLCSSLFLLSLSFAAQAQYAGQGTETPNPAVCGLVNASIFYTDITLASGTTRYYTTR